MLKNLIILPDGTEISSGLVNDNAIMSCTYTQCCNDGAELSLGSVCCNELELKLYMKDGTLPLSAGGVIRYYKLDTESNARTKLGEFICEKPTFVGTNTFKVIAYDRVSRLDRNLSEWLDALNGWPYNVITFATMVCAQCGLGIIAPTNLPNAKYLIQKISGDGITGRDLMQWLGEITCRFIRANADGKIEFAWYSDKGKTIEASGDFRYFGSSLSYEDYQTAKIEKVQLKVAGSEVGTVYPDGSEDEKTTYTISGNYLLRADTNDELEPVAEAIYAQLQSVQYTPCQVSIQSTLDINAGDIVHVVDSLGNKIMAYIMTKVNKGQRDTLTCSGSSSRGSTTAVNTVSVRDQNGKRLTIVKSIDGLRAENANMAGDLSALEMTVDGISTRVESAEGDISKLEQDAQGLSARVESVDKRVSKVEIGAGEVNVVVQSSVKPYYFRINAAGELIYSTQDTSTMFSINDDGELVCTYEGDTPDLHIDDNGYLILENETSDTAVLRTVINAEGEWESVYSVNGEEQSSIRFDFAAGRFVFNGTIEATAGDIGGCQIEDGTLVVGGWSTGEVTIPGVSVIEGYTGKAIWSQTSYDATTREESAVAFTPKGLYVYGRDSLGGAVCEYASWEDIIRAANNN